MNQTVEIIAKKYGIDGRSRSPVNLPITRIEMAKLFHELGFRSGAEIGTFDGAYAKVLCENIPKASLFAIDAWEIYDGLPELKIEKKSTKDYVNNIRASYEDAKNLLSPYSVRLVKKYSLDAAKDFNDSSLDFVYIDANHSFDYVIQDIIAWSRVVRSGGIVSGHDYHCPGYREVAREVSTAVNTYVGIHKTYPLFITVGDRSASWFFVKP